MAVLVVLAVLSLWLSLSEMRRVDRARLATSFDARDYISIAESLHRGEGYAIPDGETIASRSPTSYRTPGYPFLLFGMLQIFGHDHYLIATLVLQNLLLAALPSLFFWLTSLVGGDQLHALLAAVVCFLFVPYRVLALLIQPELLALGLVLAALCLLLQFRRQPHLVLLVGSSLCLGTAIMVKQNLVPLLLLLVVPLPRLLTRRQLVIVAVAPVLFVAAWCARNTILWGRFPLFTTTSGLNLYLAFNPHLSLDMSNQNLVSREQRRLMEQGLDELEASDELRRRGWQELRERSLGWHLRWFLSKLRVQFRELFPFVKNELLYILLPVALALRKPKTRRLALLALILFQLIYGHFAYDLALTPSGWYYRNLVDITALSAMALLSFLLLIRTRRVEMLLLATVYLLIIAPALILFPVDRMTYLADAVLIVLYALAPAALAQRFSHAPEADACESTAGSE